MGMGIPMGMEIPWESHGNGNESWKWNGREWELNRWEWERMGMLEAIPADLNR